MSRFARLLTSAAMLVVVAGAADGQEALRQAPSTSGDASRGLDEWEKVHAVFAHPRCANCHVEDDHPRWSGPEFQAARYHGFNVRRGEDGSGFGNAGLRCTTCHFDSNSSVLHGPPGAEGWHLAPAEMVWWQKSSAEICAQIKDPARNGGRTLDEVAVHVRDDKLVAWGWAPGPGREPAPGSAGETYEAIKNWIAAGAPCPGG